MEVAALFMYFCIQRKNYGVAKLWQGNFSR